MATLPLRQATTQESQSRRPPISTKGLSQTIIDVYLRPNAQVKQEQNDIRNYFPPVTKVNAYPKGMLSKSSSSAKMPVTLEPTHGKDGAAKGQTPGPSKSLKSPTSSLTSTTLSQQSDKKALTTFARTPKHKHANSAVLPKFDPFFDNEDFPHSISPMAPRVNDFVRHSLVPKPLNIKLPPPTALANLSPTGMTSSPSSAGDPDTAFLDGERREAPSFKQTYRGVHSRQNTNDGTVSPLIALRDPGPQPFHQRVDRPTTLRYNSRSRLSDNYSSESVIYFLPEVSPTSDSSGDEREPLLKTSYPRSIDTASTRHASKAKKQAVELENVSRVQIDRSEDALEERDVTVTPGVQRYLDYLASKKSAASVEEKVKDGDRRKKKGEILSVDPSDSGSSKEKTKKKKGRGLLRLVGSYSKHVEGLQMIQ